MSSHRGVNARGESGGHGGCHYMDGLLAVRSIDGRDAIDVLRREQPDIDDVTDEVLSERVRSIRTPRMPDGPPIRILSVTENPHRSAAILANRRFPLPASPIHGVGYEGHAGYMAGEGPEDVDNGELTGPEPCDTEGWIAVVDSGLVDEGSRPEWMRDPDVKDYSAEPENIDGAGASHGTYVTSLLRMVAPEYRVAFAAAPPDRSGRLTSEIPGDDVADPPTDELAVLEAVARLVEALKDQPHQVKALNLSLGAPRCGGVDEGFLLIMKEALELWRTHFGNHAPIFAAGGNSVDPNPVYPAAFDGVRGVGAAIDNRSEQRVWAGDGTAQVAGARIWIDDVAPGLGIHGSGGKTESHVVKWSGSSFASAVATGLYVSGAPFQVADGVSYWQASPVVYSQVAGLQPYT